MSTKRKLPSKLGVPFVKPSAKDLSRTNVNVDESKVVVSKGGQAVKSFGFKPGEVIAISSASSSEAEEELEDEEDEEDDKESQQSEKDEEEDISMLDADGAGKVDPGAEIRASQDEEEGGEVGEPSFGELIQAQLAEPVIVAEAKESEPDTKLTIIDAPTGASLGTVLTQALRTNDVVLLESCLHTRDIATIRATIQRLESPLAGSLLQKLAERLHGKPGRAGSLLIWVQWTLVTHGGYLATQRDLMQKLVELNKVISERAKSLNSLLSLKGKLDMLEAQIELRRNMQMQHARGDDEDEEGVIYVEGEESDEEDVVVNGKADKDATTAGAVDDIDGDSEVTDDTPNGIMQQSEDEDGESPDEDLIDDEAEETDADRGDEGEVDHDDADSIRDADESDDEAPPAKAQRISSLTSKRHPRSTSVDHISLR